MTRPLTTDDGHHLAKFIADRLKDLRTRTRHDLTGDVATMMRVETASRAALVLAAHHDLRHPTRRNRALRTLAALAAPYAWHPDYNPTWAPPWLTPNTIRAMRRAMTNPNAATQLTPHTQTEQAPEPVPTADPPAGTTAPPGWANVTHALRRGANLWEPGQILHWAGPDAVIRWPDGDVQIVNPATIVAAQWAPEGDPATIDDDPELDDDAPLDDPAWVEVLTPDDTAAHTVSIDR